MNTKLIIAAAALAVSVGSAFTFTPAMAGEPQVCGMARAAIAAQRPTAAALAGRCAAGGGNAYGLPPVALGRVAIPAVNDFCALARNSIAAHRPTAGALVQRCLATGGDVNLPSVQLPPIVISQPVPAPAPAPQPSGSNVDPGDYENASNDGISCDEGRNIVRHSGFRKVRAIDCSNDVFSYSAKKLDQRVKVYVNADGNIVHVSNFSY